MSQTNDNLIGCKTHAILFNKNLDSSSVVFINNNRQLIFDLT